MGEVGGEVLLLLLIMPTLLGTRSMVARAHRRLASPSKTCHFAFCRHTIKRSGTRVCCALACGGHPMVRRDGLNILVRGRLFRSTLNIPGSAYRF